MLLLLLTLALGCGDKDDADSGATSDGGAADGGSADGGADGGAGDGGAGDGGNPDDMDDDGYTPADGDCDDSDPDVHPGATEIPWDDIDQDCDDEDAGSIQSADGLGDLAIPDLGSVSSTAIIGPCDTVYGTTVDIDLSHTWIGDLVVTLIAPNGDTNALHVRGGEDGDDIVGTYSSEPGASLDAVIPLENLDGTVGTGTWTLEIYDMDEDDVGTLNSWSLELRCP